jgi:hypothetical protein
MVVLENLVRERKIRKLNKGMCVMDQLPKKLKSDKNKDCVLENYKPTIHVKLFPIKTSKQSSVVVKKKPRQLGLPSFP